MIIATIYKCLKTEITNNYNYNCINIITTQHYPINIYS